MSEPDEKSPSTASGGPPPREISGRMKKAPRWTIPFLRALERTGNARASAEEAGVDHTTAYLRRRTHPDFASDWEWVLKAHAERVEREKEAELEALRVGLSPPLPNPSPAEGGGAE